VYKVRILVAAVRELSELDKPIARRIVSKINWLAENLDYIRREKLVGDLASFFKLRVGNFRVIYEVLDQEQVIVIHKIGPRREVYRRQ
jgi:mRNA interferase RelE/StbE